MGSLVPENLDVATWVKSIRSDQGLSQAAFSERYGLPIRTIQNWEQSRRKKMDAAGYLVMRMIEKYPDYVAAHVREMDVQVSDVK